MGLKLNMVGSLDDDDDYDNDYDYDAVAVAVVDADDMITLGDQPTLLQPYLRDYPLQKVRSEPPN